MSTITTRIGGLFRNLFPGRSETVGEIDAMQRGEYFSRTGPALSKREAVIEELREGYQVAMETMRAVREHMERQSQYNERMLTVLEKLPEALQSLPESQRSHARVAEALHEQVALQGRHIRNVEGMLEHHNRALDAVSNQIGASRETEEARQEAMIAMGHTVQSVCRTSQESGRELVESVRQSQREVSESMRRSSRWMTVVAAVAVVCGVVAAYAMLRGAGVV